MEEVDDRNTRDIHEGYDFNIKDVQGVLSYAHSFKTLKKKQEELLKERNTLIRERNLNPQIFYSSMWFFEAQLMDTSHKLDRLKQRLKEKIIPNQIEMDKLLQQRNIWRLNFNDRWAMYK
jgi:hypothetical protein